MSRKCWKKKLTAVCFHQPLNLGVFPRSSLFQSYSQFPSHVSLLIILLSLQLLTAVSSPAAVHLRWFTHTHTRLQSFKQGHRKELSLHRYLTLELWRAGVSPVEVSGHQTESVCEEERLHKVLFWQGPQPFSNFFHIASDVKISWKTFASLACYIDLHWLCKRSWYWWS